MKYLATILITILILIAISLPGSTIPHVGFSGTDKIVHFSLFYLWSLAIRFDFNSNFRWVLGFCAGAFFGFLTEVIQIFVEGRTYDYFDMLTDTIGLSVGLLTGPFVLNLIFRLWSFGKKK